jgi:hypothetical protein
METKEAGIDPRGERLVSRGASTNTQATVERYNWNGLAATADQA